MKSSHTIRLLTSDDADAWAERRVEALTAHPLLFGSPPPADASRLVEFFRTQVARSDSSVLGAFEIERLTGIVGVLRESGVKERHKAFLWGMYVAPGARRRGVGRALVAAAVDQVRRWAGVEQLHLSVSEAPDGAKSLYEHAGFVAWGREPRALMWQGESVDETHMVLDLKAPHAG